MPRAQVSSQDLPIPRSLCRPLRCYSGCLLCCSMSRSSLPCLAKYRLRYLGGKLNTTHPPTELCLTMSSGPLQAQQIFSHLRATLSHISLLQCVMVFFCIFSCFQKFNTELKGLKKKVSHCLHIWPLFKKKKEWKKIIQGIINHPSSYLIQSPSLLSRLGLTGTFYLAWLCPSMLCGDPCLCLSWLELGTRALQLPEAIVLSHGI